MLMMTVTLMICAKTTISTVCSAHCMPARGRQVRALNVMLLHGVTHYDLSSIPRLFNCLSKVIKVTVA